MIGVTVVPQPGTYSDGVELPQLPHVVTQVFEHDGDTLVTIRNLAVRDALTPGLHERAASGATVPLNRLEVVT